MRSTQRLANLIGRLGIVSLAAFCLIQLAHAGEVTSFTVYSRANRPQTDVPVTFGQAFRPGDVPANQTLTAKLPNGKAVPLQVDPKATNRDGSLRHAVLTAELPNIESGAHQTVSLYAEPRQGQARGAGIKPAELIRKGFNATVHLTLDGKRYTASAAKMLSTGGAKKWLSGPLVTEWLVGGAVKSVDGVANPHLAVYFYVRAYRGLSRARVDVVVENDWSYVPDPKNLTYGVHITVGGKRVYSQKDLVHYAHARWHKVFWWGQAPAVGVRVDLRYLMRAGALPPYNRLKVPSRVLDKLRSELAPMQRGSISKYMPGPGANPDIGPLPRWTALYVVTGDPRAKRAMLLNGDAGGSFSIHYRDKKTGLPISIQDYPYATLLGHVGDTVNPKTGRSEAFPPCGGDCKSPYVPDSAHQPSIAYVPYLVTGDYFYLQELQFWADWNVFRQNPYYRKFEKGLLWDQSVRGQAWSLRELARTAYITPDSSPLKKYFRRILENNIDWYTKTYADNPDANKLHIIVNGYALGYNNHRGIAPWMDDFFTWSMSELVALGFESAKPMLDWKAQFPVARMMDPGYCWISAAIYSLNVRDSKSSPLYTTLHEAYDASVPPARRKAPCGSLEMARAFRLRHAGEMTGYSQSPTGYPANMQPALAAAVDAGIPGAKKAWEKFINRRNATDFRSYPNFGVIPRSLLGSGK